MRNIYREIFKTLYINIVYTPPTNTTVCAMLQVVQTTPVDQSAGDPLINGVWDDGVKDQAEVHKQDRSIVI